MHTSPSAEIFSARLREKKLKATPRRLQLLSILGTASEPLSIPRILESFPCRGVDQATVYRTLETFRGAGIVREILTGRTRLFELSDTHHHHVTCTECGLMEDIDECAIEASLPRILKGAEQFRVIEGHSLELFGICRKCAV